jgi:hypothetical protein
MIFIRSKTNKQVAFTNVFPDDRVIVAMSKIANQVKSSVYIWCHKPVTCYEALGIICNDIGWESFQEEFEGIKISKSAKKLFGVTLKLVNNVTRVSVIESLKSSQLVETIPCAFRYLNAGGYFADHGVDPTRSIPINFDVSEYGLVDTSQMTLESFGTDEFYFSTEQDIQENKPKDTNPNTWKSVINRYRFNYTRLDFFEETIRYNELVEEQSMVEVAENNLTYIKIVSKCLFVRRDVDDLMTVFTSFETSPDIPMLRIGSHSLGTVFTRIHDSLLGSNEAERYIVSNKKIFLQVLIRIPETKFFSLLEIFPDKYYVSARFTQRDMASTQMFSRVFEDINKFLYNVSPYYIPLTPSVFRSDYIHFSSKISDFRPVMSDMWVSVVLNSKKKICDSRSFYNAGSNAGPILNPVNISNDEKKTFFQFVRSNNVSRESLVQHFLYQNFGASRASLLRRIVSDYKFTPEQGEQIMNEFFEYSRFMSPNVTKVRVHKQSSSRIVVKIELIQDERYTNRIVNCICTLLNECLIKSNVRRNAVASIDVMKTLSAKVQSKVGDIDDFVQFINISEPGIGYSTKDDVEIGESGMGSDVLRALQYRDPTVFGFRAEGVFRPYSVQCQDRQPVILTDEEFENAKSKSSENSFKGSLSYGSNEAYNFICPQKWCVTSKVARKTGEACPLKDEPTYDFKGMTYPGYISGSKHPTGLCMPCCFKREPVPGSKVYERELACNSKTGIGITDSVNSHVSRSSRILDQGAFGKISEKVSRKYIPEGIVRRGMGTNVNFFDSVELVFQDESFFETFSNNVQYHHFLTGSPRDVSSKIINELEKDLEKDFDEWWTSSNSSNYRNLLGFSGKLKQGEKKIEMKSYAYFKRSTPKREDPHTFWLRPINSFSKSSYPHVIVVNEKENEDVISVEMDEIREDRTDVVFILHREGRYEPMGYINSNAFQTKFPITQAWVKTIIEQQKYTSIPKQAKRVLSTSRAVVALLFGNNSILKLSQPIPFNPRYGHVHIYKIGANTGISHDQAKNMFRTSNDDFYKNEYIADTAMMIKEIQTDIVMFLRETRFDKRDEVLKEIRQKTIQESKYAKIIWDVINKDPILSDGKKQVSVKIAQLRNKYKSKLPKLQDHVIDYIIEKHIRPVGISSFPSVNKSDSETIFSSSK